MRDRSMTVFVLATLALLVATPRGSSAAGATTTYVFGSVGMIDPLDVDVTDHDVGDNLVFHDFKGDRVVEGGVGGGFWRAFGDGPVSWGIRGDLFRSNPDQPPQSPRAVGDIEGTPFDGPIDLGRTELEQTTLAASFVVRFNSRRGGGEATRVKPYLGVGGGIEWLEERLDDGAHDRDSSPMLQATGGVDFAVSGRFSIALEYRFTRADHDFVFGTARDNQAQEAHHLGAAFTLHF